MTVDDQASVIHIGLKYLGMLKTTNIETGQFQFTSQARPKNVYRVTTKFYNTLGAKVGTNQYDLEPYEFRQTQHRWDNPPELFTGEKDLYYPDLGEREKHVVIVQDEPLPCNVSSIIVHSSTEIA